MRRPALRNFKLCCFGFLFAASLLPSQARAQSVWDKIKQKAKEAAQQGQQTGTTGQQQGQQQGQQGQQPQAQSPSGQGPTQVASAAQPQPAPAPASAASAEPGDPQAGAPTGDCCSADAQKKTAAAASFLDIVGIKLGMSPQEATAALRAYNAGYKVAVVNSRLERPSNPQGMVRVPRYIFAQSANMNPSNGQVEHITIQFTTPPNPAVVQEVERYVQFRVGEPVLASNLMNNFRQKYGQENSGNPGGPTWVYDSNGKLLTQVPNAALNCKPTGNLSSYIVQSDLTHDAQDGGINLSNTVDGQGTGSALTPGCVPYLYAEAWGTGVTPNDKVTAMSVSIRSGALTYNSMKSTHGWLQAEADAIRKKQDADAAGRSGPKL